ncbi:glycosyltransferase family 4 protein [Natronolimnohabitans innermongolicus]|uniref:Group 1 glycosyl transferase n=1 Tax=Natronolimnohabitans innermongolicus JCM 12255 TaxID=1227499 RepID=L9XI97_9EURY|nr:glycosyltransferase family 4 protein [Natronolimnohabitans innermongolicus]ELY61126.1 group 1 glycosyl transferase [Natronolimnohabitans innermongolicus JCM 12255]
MRILRVAQKAYPDVKGGGAYHVHAMSRDQAAMGHDVTVLTVRTDPEQPWLEERDGYTVVRYDPTITLLGNDLSSGVAQYLLEADDFDVIHAHSHLYFSTNLAALKSFLGDVPLAITNHGLYSQTAPEWVFDWYLKTAGRWTFNQADVVFCYTDVDRERLREFGVKSEIEVVSNGIDTERFAPDGPTSDLVDSDGPAVLFVGRLVEGKRPRTALEAMEGLLEHYPDATLYLFGDGSLRSELESYTRENNLEDAVEFVGSVPYDRMPDVYRSGDALLLPSRSEGMPRTVLEAMSTETPVVSSRLPQLVQLLPDGNETVEIGDVDGFTTGLTNVFDTQQADTGQLTNRETILEEHSWHQTATETTAALSRLVTEGRP